ncbi:MAG: hypothetical protein LBT79_04880, partial [Elusimicrobiota bacterium]|nr:hypothetical protein [Elusimicrobiota bacterium]
MNGILSIFFKFTSLKANCRFDADFSHITTIPPPPRAVSNHIRNFKFSQNYRNGFNKPFLANSHKIYSKINSIYNFISSCMPF